MYDKPNRVSDAPTLQSLIRESWDPLQRAERRMEAARRLAELERILCGELTPTGRS
jgi:hypothetical protein